MEYGVRAIKILLSYSQYIPYSICACFNFTLLTRLNFLHICPLLQLPIALIKGVVRGVLLCWFPW